MIKKLGLGALALMLALGVGLWTSQRPATTQTAGLPDLTGMAAAAQTIEVPDMALGNPDAKVTIYEYASYTCPHCATFHEAAFKPLKRDYIDSGKVRFVMREVYFDRYGLWAAMVARCGGEERYFGISGMLFEQQRDWVQSDNPQATVESLRRIGRTAGMDDAQLNTCLENADMAQAMVARFQETAQADDVTATPTLIINGTKHSNMSYDELRAIIDAELAK
ncbi:MAG TPA: DsbA family protein [Paracoccaceae bacterium]|nr:DsbA family protein [Paracoccaceae bacterium]